MKMKSPLKKLFHNGRHKESRDQEKSRRFEHSRSQLDEITRASQDMEDMRECYNSLLSAAAATANSAYEFSESLKEMGTCLLQKTALDDDEESGKVLLMLGKLQFELQGLVDKYRAHIFQTITVPSESLLNEIRNVEEMKKLCDEKRSLYENMKMHQVKKKSKCSKGETFSPEQVTAAREEYDQEATLFVFRLKSLKQGQSRSLLTQAARHHASQMNFFKKALLCAESVEPHVERVTEENHIDYHFTGLEDDTNDDNDTDYDDGDSYSSNESDDDEDYSDDENVELSFEYRMKEPVEVAHTPAIPTPKSSVEEKLSKKSPRNSFNLEKELKAVSQSAPLSAEKNFDTNKRLRELQSLNSKKFHTYVLPTPTERKVPIPARPNTQPLENTNKSPIAIPLNYRHSSPMERLKYSRSMKHDKSSMPILRSQSPVLRESNMNAKITNIAPSKSAEIPLRAYDRYAAYDADRSRRQSLSGPLIGTSGTSKLGAYSSSGYMPSATPPKVYAPIGLRPSSLSPPPRPTSLSPSRSPNASPPLISSPKISELHELPRPPRRISSPLPPPPQQMPVS